MITFTNSIVHPVYLKFFFGTKLIILIKQTLQKVIDNTRNFCSNQEICLINRLQKVLIFLLSPAPPPPPFLLTPVIINFKTKYKRIVSLLHAKEVFFHFTNSHKSSLRENVSFIFHTNPINNVLDHLK